MRRNTRTFFLLKLLLPRRLRGQTKGNVGVDVAAQAAALGTRDLHHPRILGAFAVGLPLGATRILIDAQLGARSARVQALTHHGFRICRALVVSPDGTLGRVLLFAHLVLLAGLARERALLEHEGWVLDAMTLLGPPRTIWTLVVACVRADAARVGTYAENKVGILLAPTLFLPLGALWRTILAWNAAQTAAHGTLLEHEVAIRRALIILCPRMAVNRVVVTTGGAQATTGGTLAHDHIRVIAVAFSGFAPGSTRRRKIAAQTERKMW